MIWVSLGDLPPTPIPDIQQKDAPSAIKRLYHPNKIMNRTSHFMKIGTMAERTVEMVSEVPFLQTFLVEDMQTLEFMNLLSAEDRLEAYNTAVGCQKRSEINRMTLGSIPDKVAIHRFWQTHRIPHARPPLIQGAGGRNGIEPFQPF